MMNVLNWKQIESFLSFLTLDTFQAGVVSTVSEDRWILEVGGCLCSIGLDPQIIIIEEYFFL